MISQCYGVGRFLDDLCGIINPETLQKHRKFLAYLRFTWTYISPVLCGVLFFVTVVVLFTENFNSYVCAETDDGSTAGSNCGDAQWGIGFGIFLSFAAASALPSAAIYVHFNKNAFASNFHPGKGSFNAEKEQELTTRSREIVNPILDS